MDEQPRRDPGEQSDARAKEDDVSKAFCVILTFVIVGLVGVGTAVADEAPISGTVKAIDASANTLTLQTTANGKTRDVTIVLKPDSKIVKFVRATEPGKTGFVEQPLTLADLRPGWVVSVTARHEGGNEVAEVVKVVLEK
jgi:hypothetical protein